MKNILSKVVNNPRLLLVHLFQCKPFCYMINDKKFVKLYYRTYIGEELDLDHPDGFNEKLQWLKIYDRRKEYVELTDKYAVRDYVSNKIGEHYLMKLLGCWSKPEEIDYDTLPSKFVLKCTHDSHSVIICEDKDKIKKKEINNKLSRALKFDYYYKSREHNYHGIKPRIIAEEFLEDKSEYGLLDYRFYCFDGEPKFIAVDSGILKNPIRNIYSLKWEYMDVRLGHPNSKDINFDKPVCLDEMIKISRILSSGLPHVRIDLMLYNDRIIFGEMTFHHAGGVQKIIPDKYDKKWGEYINLESLDH